MRWYHLLLAVVLLSSLAMAQDSVEPSIAELIRRLGAPVFREREAAMETLLKLGEPARTSLQKAVQETADLEILRRSEAILRQLDEQALNKRRRELLEKTLAARKEAKTPDFDPTRVRDLVEKQGVLKTSETWTAARSYRVTGPLTVPAKTTLTIEPGTVVLLDAGANIHIQKGGVLTARSKDASKPIILTAVAERDRKDGHWGELRCKGSLQLEHVQVRRSSGVQVFANTTQLLDVGIYRTAGNALSLQRNNGKHERVTIREASGIGLELGEEVNPTFHSLTVAACQIGIQFDLSSHPTLTDVFVHDMKAQGMLAVGDAYPRLTQVTVAGCETGFHMTGGSYPQVKSLTVLACLQHGVLVEDNSTPEIEDLTLQGIGGAGLVLRGSSHARVGKITAIDCKQGESFVEAGSRIRPWTKKAKQR